MKKYFKPYFQFLIKPYYPSPQKVKALNLSPLIDFGSLLLFTLIADSVLMIPNEIGLVNADFKAAEIYESLKQLGWLLFYFIGAILFPVIEELLFRLHLKSVKGSYIFYLFICFVLAVLLINAFFLRTQVAVALFVLLCVFLFTILLTWPYLKQYQFTCIRFLLKYFHIHVWLSAVVFAMMHVTNYTLYSTTALLLSPLLVLPQLFAGLTLSYIRLKYGILSSIIMHGLHNGLLFTVMYLSE
ncbi:MAG: CPBP family glutamic-type intramembrane protease [Bacteroidia bacterium]|jgi:membrane protease YdiL (CAAX protease family)|nr:CPBP family glutamic-type intramembrane protease [Bacteroidia bacterium]